ncbi:MAG: hypothetical protein LBT61_03780, partial [Prevotellaceae bacterium]|nr:hypothetical protein [Prevotellaceae bacterium]
GANYRIPKGTDPAALTVDKCKEIIAAQQAKQAGEGKPKAKAKAKTAATAKTTAKKTTKKSK